MDIKLFLQQAEKAIKDKDIDKAKSIYTYILKNDPTNFIANTQMGIFNILSNSLDEGLEFLKTALNGNQNRGEAWTNYIKYLLRAKMYKEAQEIIKEGKLKGLHGVILDQLETISLFVNDSTFPEERKKFISYFLEGKYKELLGLESSFNSKFSNEAIFHYLIAVSLIQIGSNENSINRLKKSINLNSDLVDSYRILIPLLVEINSTTEVKEYRKRYLKLKSKDVNTKSDIIEVIDMYFDKLDKQNGVTTFFDNAVKSHIEGNNVENVDYCKIFESSNEAKNNRFISYSDRVLCTNNKRQINGLPLILSQGTHSLMKWKEFELYKTANDISIYTMILNEIKPEIIIELGSGSGGSAIWMADISRALGFKPHIFSYDINKPDLEYEGIDFIEFDINKLDINEGFPLLNSLNNKRKLIIEDAHVNLSTVFNTLDILLSIGDYFMIEDSSNKQKYISQFIKDKPEKYKVDQFYLDFFGINMGCFIDSIFKVFS
tara:strand:- start:2820 stop:4289 length:1470 start_codon:yes stop_codon:yes gene_type:complete